MTKVRGRKGRQSKTDCKRMITLRLDSVLHGIILRDAENKNISSNTLLLELLNLHYGDDIIMTKSTEWKLAESYIGKIVKGKDVESGKIVEGKCYGIDCHVKLMGQRGIFLVVESPKLTIRYKIDFSTFDKQ